MNLNDNKLFNNQKNNNLLDNNSIKEFNNFIENTLSNYKTKIIFYETNQEPSNSIYSNDIGDYISTLQNQISSLTSEIEKLTNYNKELSSQITKLNIQLKSKDQNIFEMNNKLNNIKDLYNNNEIELKQQHNIYKNIIESFINSLQETLQSFSFINKELNPSKPLLNLRNQLKLISHFIETIIHDNKTLIEINEQLQIHLKKYETNFHPFNKQSQDYENRITTNQFNKNLPSNYNNEIFIKGGKYEIVNEYEMSFIKGESKLRYDGNEYKKSMKRGQSIQQYKETQQNIFENQNENLKINSKTSNRNINEGSNYIGNKYNYNNNGNYNIDLDLENNITNINKESIKQPLFNLQLKIEMLEKIFKEQEANYYIKDEEFPY